MKYFVVSDIHGDSESAAKIEMLFKQSNCSNILCLGDILYHGPRNPLPAHYDTKKTAEILNGLADKIISISGNCDSDVDQMVLNFPILQKQTAFFFHAHRIILNHGHLQIPFPILNNDIVIQGHTHIPVAIKQDDHYFCNPGSITLPKQDHPATYGILTEHDFTVYTLDQKPYMCVRFD